MKPLTPQKVLCACFQKTTTTILLIGCHVRVIIIFKNSHTHNFCPAYFGLVCYIVICVFLSSLYFSLAVVWLHHTHTHTQTDTQTLQDYHQKFFSFFLVIFCCDLVLRHRVKKEFFLRKRKKSVSCRWCV